MQGRPQCEAGVQRQGSGRAQRPGMIGSLLVYRGLIVLALAVGAALTWWRPNGPLLAWWLLCALGLGSWVAFSARWKGLGARARQLVRLYSILVFAALLSTQVAA